MGPNKPKLLLFAALLGGCAAGGTVCSEDPSICDGTYNRTALCVLPPSHKSEKRMAPLCSPMLAGTFGIQASAAACPRNSGSSPCWRRCKHTPHRPSHCTPQTSSVLPSPLGRQVPSRKQTERLPALATREAHRADGSVSLCRTPHPHVHAHVHVACPNSLAAGRSAAHL